jgi:hypothetical protein
MSEKKKKKVQVDKKGQETDVLKIDKTFTEAIKATMIVADKKSKKQ